MTYNPSLDGLRAIAVLLVVLFHAKIPGVPGGFIGVDVFFVLSGFLITTILRAELTKTGRIQIFAFYWNRILRLYPPLILMLIAWFFLMPIHLPDLDRVRNGAIALFYLSDYALAFGSLKGHLGHTWSLAVEEHFYMIWPFVLILTRTFEDKKFVIFCICLFTVATAWRVADFTLFESWSRTYHRFDTRLAGLTLGSAVAAWPGPNREGGSGIAAIVALTMILVASTLLQWGSLQSISIGMFLVHIASASLILSLRNAQGITSQILATKGLVYIGLLSYSIYLWHFPISKVLLKFYSSGTTLALVLPITIIISALSFELMEKPLRKYRAKRGA